MLFNSNQFNLNIVLLILLGTYNKVNLAMALQCYVCGIKENLNCDNFDPTNSIFIEKCPSNAQSCSVQILGNAVITRSCENITLDDCETANKVQYCYCLQDLCNGKFINFTDDEDLHDEGSGITFTTTSNVESVQKDTSNNITNVSNHIQFYLYNTYTLIIALLCK